MRHLALLLLLGLTAAPLWAGPVEPMLSAEERSYLQQLGPIQACVDPDWEPFEWLNAEGQHQGIAADLLQLVAQRLQISIEVLPLASWDESIKASQEGRCQLLSFLNQTPEREQWLSFTAPIFFDPNVIITREEHDYIAYPKGLVNHTVALPRNTMVAERLRSDYPNLIPLLTTTEAEAINLVSERKADLTVRSLIVAAYTIKREGLFNLKIAGQLPDMTNQLRIGVIKTEPQLRAILDKGVASISDTDRELITNKYVSVVVEATNYRLLGGILALTLLAVLAVAFWNRKLRRLNHELERLSVTDKLTGLYNRIRLDQAFEEELQRARRSQPPFSIILVDVDFFKRVNDVHGHQRGDQVLQTFAQLLLKHTRQIDLVGRWGGEEFLIICPHTDLSGARNLAENLRLQVEQLIFPAGLRLTASFGVASFSEGDSASSMTARADSALYRAKEGGRNQVGLS
ncbi:MAG: diguanylate cyclase [Gammaproteobacteria bacterium]|nr:diguanylate cyclase [Gammaproteobacteria bacterium]